MLAAIDAIAWPALWILAINHAPVTTGIVGPLVTAIAVLSALRRLHKAMTANHRYRFTTWRWGRVAAALLVIGVLLKVMLGI